MQEPMERALDKVRSASGITMADLFEILGASLRTRAQALGRAVLYGASTRVVRMPGGSWPFAVVRKTRAARWIGFSCRTEDVSCHHSKAAAEAARRATQGKSESDSDSSSGGEDDVGIIDAGDTPSRADAPARSSGGATAASAGVNRMKLAPQSMQSRHIVPPRAAQAERASILRSLRDPIWFPAAEECPYCHVKRSSGLPRRQVSFERGEGVAVGMIYVWRCSVCNLRVIPRGRDRGIIFVSSSSAFSEVFLFETSVSLCRNGSSLNSSAYLREAYREPSPDYVFPDASESLSSVSTLRKAIVLYLFLVIAGVPAAVTRCASCVRTDGNYAIFCFDSLQLGYRLKFMIRFRRLVVSLSPIARASVHAHVIMDEALAKALGSVLSSSDTSKKGSITTITSMRGYVMAFVMLNGYVLVTGVAKTFAGSSEPSTKVNKRDRGWDPISDGGARPELIMFLRAFFMCRRAARAVAMDIIGGPRDLLRRVPIVLMEAVHASAADLSDDSAEVSSGAAAGEATEDEAATGLQDNVGRRC